MPELPVVVDVVAEPEVHTFHTLVVAAVEMAAGAVAYSVVEYSDVEFHRWATANEQEFAVDSVVEDVLNSVAAAVEEYSVVAGTVR